MRAFALFLATLAALFASPVLAQTFPELTGRVVDAANVIPADVEAQLDAKLTEFETRTQRQFVVATVPSLEGYDIADYGYRLGRKWGIGDKEGNDGVILLVAPNDRKVRIEVGYGLEPVLTDGYSTLIVQNTILPAFKAGDMPGGIAAGTDMIIKQLELPPEEAAKVAQAAQAQSTEGEGGFPVGVIVWMVFIFLFFILPMMRGRRRGGRHNGSLTGSTIGDIVLWEAGKSIAQGFLGRRLGRRRIRWRRRRLFRRRRQFRRRRRLGRLVMGYLNDAEHDRVSSAVSAAEEHTAGEIVTVLAERSDGYSDIQLGWAFVAATLALALMVAFPDFYLGKIDWVLGQWNSQWTPRGLLGLALFVVVTKFAAMWLIQLWQPLRFFLVPGPVKQARVREAAVKHFKVGAERRTHGRTGVLIYLSMREHRAEIVADEAIAEMVSAEVWGGAMADMLTHIREGRIAEGLAIGITDVGVVLSEHFPRLENDVNELPDRLIEV